MKSEQMVALLFALGTLLLTHLPTVHNTAGTALSSALLAAYPDLIVTEIVITPGPSNDVFFTVYIKNQGTVSTAAWGPFDFSWWIDSDYMGEGGIDVIDAGETIHKNTHWYDSPGWHTVKFHVDYFDFIPESDENNNDRTESFCASGQYDLGIVKQFQHKDTNMLCLKGCSLTGDHAWNVSHSCNGCDHDNWYCVRASISMINSFYGGKLSQDRLSFYYFEERSGAGDDEPEGDLGHGQGIPREDWLDVLSWSLNGAAITYHNGKPSFDQIRGWLDSSRPVLRREKWNGAHATVIDGYEYDSACNELVHLIDPGTDTETPVLYATLAVDQVWVPPSSGGVTARSDEDWNSNGTPDTIEDCDSDGVCDFDEKYRFYTDPGNADTDGDGVHDREEIICYTFLPNRDYDSGDERRPNPDGDLDAQNRPLRCERDDDSDDGGARDGLEDKNKNGFFEPTLGETDPLDRTDDPAHIPIRNVDTGLDYMTIQEAIDAVETLDGHTIFVDSGVYYEHVNVHKSLSLVGENRDTTIIDGQGAGDTIFVDANGVIIRNFTLINSGSTYPNSGIFLNHVENSIVVNNNVSHNKGHGIFVMWGRNNTLLRNLVTHNAEPGIRIDGINAQALVANCTIERNQVDGIFLYAISEALIENNTISNNVCSGVAVVARGLDQGNVTIRHNSIIQNGRAGVWLNGDRCLIESNLIVENGFALPWQLSGIEIVFGATDSTIKGNTIADNKIGVWMNNCSNLRVYNNNFVDNQIQAQVSFATNCVWDDSYPRGGNHWSEYTGADSCNGLFQNNTGCDGIGDIPYFIDGSNHDNYPLMMPWGCQVAYESNTTITNATVTMTGVNFETYGLDETVGYINVTVPVDFNSTAIRVFVDGFEIIPPPFPIIISNGTHYFVYFEFAQSLHYIVIRFKLIPWDITGPTMWVPDGKCDIRDIAIVAVRFGSLEGDGRYDVRADITGPTYLMADGKIDIRDIALVAIHFGEV